MMWVKVEAIDVDKLKCRVHVNNIERMGLGGRGRMKIKGEL